MEPRKPPSPSASACGGLNAPRAPIIIDEVLPKPALIRELVTRSGPYWPIQRYFGNDAERDTVSPVAASAPSNRNSRRLAGSPLHPWFRQDWANGAVLVSGVEPLFTNPIFIDSAARLFNAPIVRPHALYVNLMLPSRAADTGHLDIPCFRGLDRTNCPVWLLAIMMRSGLFTAWHIKTATAVSWYYEGRGGGLKYWPEGAAHRPTSHSCAFNSALMGENETMFHRVGGVDPSNAMDIPGLNLDSELRWSGDEWTVIGNERVLARCDYESVRISVSWKGHVFADEKEQRLVDEHQDDLSVEQVIQMLVEALASQGVHLDRPAALSESGFVQVLNRHFATPRPHAPVKR